MTHSRTWLVLHACLVVILTAGCLGGSAVPAEEAKERALAAEEAYITSQLENASCVESWGLTSYSGVEKEAAVTNQTAEGVYIQVTHPYWYGTEQVEADVGSDALYLVTPEEVQRLDGTHVSPC